MTSPQGFAYQLIDHTKSKELKIPRRHAIALESFWQEASDGSWSGAPSDFRVGS
jgi:hypothetical protein